MRSGSESASYGRTGFGGWPKWLELALIAVLIVQLVRLLWTIVTPLGPTDMWQGRHATFLSAPQREQLFRSFDAFYRAPVTNSGAANVTSLALTLHGIRINEGSGLGSAIIAGSDAVQNSYAVGDEIQPGVVLKAVAFDHVTIDRSGVEESIYLDQSAPVTSSVPTNQAKNNQIKTVPAPPTVSQADAKRVKGAVTLDDIKSGVGFGPRMSDGRITGLLVSRKGAGFEGAGFREGDVITQINGRPINAADDLAVLQNSLAPGARISLMVERGANVVPIAMIIQDK